ncbi:MAG: amino acid permease [Streptococcaceae bacterium]|jgi:L-asparagine transporter-like permease|nr:amino acid permease [Streptococcaceae bacterium]
MENENVIKDTNNNTELKASMKPRHLVMLSLGGSVGAGLFAGAGSAINMAGPAVLLTYILSGLLLFVVMYGVGQIVILQKVKSTGMSGLVGPILGGRMGNFIDWVYWLLSLSVLIAVAAPIAQFLQVWWPNLPTWLVYILIAGAAFTINLFSVKFFAETGFWMSAIKVGVLVILMVLGLVLIAGKPTYLANLTSQGGFAPNGFKGIFNAMLIVVFSFGGMELMALSAAETDNPSETIPKAVRSMIIQLSLVYIIPVFIFVTVYPWNKVGSLPGGPVAAIFEKFHLPFVSNIILAVMILALFSVLNSMYFGAIRSLYARSKEAKNPIGKFFAKLSKNQVPMRANAFNAGVLILGAILSKVIKGGLFEYMSSAISYLLIIVWIVFLISAILLYHKHPEAVKSWVKIVSYATLVLLIGILIGVVATNKIEITIYAAIVCLISFLTYVKPKLK